MDPIGVLLRRYRLAAGLTQEGLAERAQLSVRGLSDLERGLHRAPHPETLRRLAQALELGDAERELLSRAARQRPLAATPLLTEPLSTFLGRQRELADLLEVLPRTRLLTLTGPGGVGKTRLAVRLAQYVRAEYADGVYLVELAALAEPALLAQVVAQGVGVQELGGQALPETLAGALGNRDALLVLDNCEHLVDACASLVERLLRAGACLRILATSREPLGVAGEVAWPVPVLEVVAGAQLFEARARAVDPSFVLSERNAAAVAEVCRRLDGLPLAIELAAARARVLTPAEILARLDDRFAMLVAGGRTAPPRHQTLRAAVDWSYDLLDEAERSVFDRLSVFAGGFSLSAAEAVCATPHVLAGLAGLVDRSLVLVDRPGDSEETRYRLLETLRDYGRERLLARGEADLLATAHARWALGLAEQAARAFHGPDEDQWLRRLELEHDNLRAALRWSTRSGDADTALRLVGALSWFDGLRGAWTEGRGWLERALAMPAPADSARPRAAALAMAGRMAAFQGDFVAAQTWLDEGAGLALRIGDDGLVLAARGAETLVLQFSGAGAAAEQLAAELLGLARRLGDHWWEGRLLAVKAGAALQRGDYPGAREHLEAGVRLARGSGDVWSLAMALSALGDVERANQAVSRAAELYAESLALRARLRLGGTGAPSLWHNLGYLAIASGDLAGAAARFTAARAEFRRLGERRGVAESVIGLAAVAAAEGRAEAAARLFGAGEAALEAAGSQLWPSNRADYERAVAMVRGALAADAFAAAWSAGRATWREQAGA